jgi:hypothetical protein
MLLVFPFLWFLQIWVVLQSRSLCSHFVGQIPYLPSVSSSFPKDFSPCLHFPARQPNVGLEFSFAELSAKARRKFLFSRFGSSVLHLVFMSRIRSEPVPWAPHFLLQLRPPDPTCAGRSPFICRSWSSSFQPPPVFPLVCAPESRVCRSQRQSVLLAFSCPPPVAASPIYARVLVFIVSSIQLLVAHLVAISTSRASFCWRWFLLLVVSSFPRQILAALSFSCAALVSRSPVGSWFSHCRQWIRVSSPPRLAITA